MASPHLTSPQAPDPLRGLRDALGPRPAAPLTLTGPRVVAAAAATTGPLTWPRLPRLSSPQAPDPLRGAQRLQPAFLTAVGLALRGPRVVVAAAAAVLVCHPSPRHRQLSRRAKNTIIIIITITIIIIIILWSSLAPAEHGQVAGWEAQGEALRLRLCLDIKS